MVAVVGACVSVMCVYVGWENDIDGAEGGRGQILQDRRSQEMMLCFPKATILLDKHVRENKEGHS